MFPKYPWLENRNLIDLSWEEKVPKGWKDYFGFICDKLHVVLTSFRCENSFFIDNLSAKTGELKMEYSLVNPPYGAERGVTFTIEELKKTRHMCAECGEDAEYHLTDNSLPFCRHCAEELVKKWNTNHKTNHSFEYCFSKFN